VNHGFGSFIHSSMVLQPFIGPLPLLQFRNLFYTDGRTPWTSDQPLARPLPEHRQHKHRINAHTDIHALSGIRTRNPRVRASEDSSCLRPRGHCDRRRGFGTVRIVQENNFDVVRFALLPRLIRAIHIVSFR
jgi:hypothetical protein